MHCEDSRHSVEVRNPVILSSIEHLSNQGKKLVQQDTSNSMIYLETYQCQTCCYKFGKLGPIAEERLGLSVLREFTQLSQSL